MYMKNLNHKMTLRLTDDLKEYVDTMSSLYGISPSDYIRQCLYMTRSSQQKAENMIKEIMTPDQLKQIAEDLKENMKEGLENGIDRKNLIDNHV